VDVISQLVFFNKIFLFIIKFIFEILINLIIKTTHFSFCKNHFRKTGFGLETLLKSDVGSTSSGSYK